MGSVGLRWELENGCAHGIEGSDAEDFINTLSGLLDILLMVLGARDTPILTGWDSCLSLDSSDPFCFVGLVDDTELPVVDSSSSLLFLSSRLLGDGDLDTFGELHERRVKLTKLPDRGRVFSSKKFGTEVAVVKPGRL